jgi:hypothetical protein
MLNNQLTKENWKDYVQDIARENFPIKKVVPIDKGNAGIIKAIGKNGQIYVKLGKLECVKADINDGILHNWYNPKKFKLVEEKTGHLPLTMIYKPEFDYNKKDIVWRRDSIFMYELRNFNLDENGLVHSTFWEY